MDGADTGCHEPMPRPAARIAATLLVLIASATASGAASSRPSQATSALSAGTKYISKRYGYEIVLRGEYVWIPASRQWDGSFPFGDTGQPDLIADARRDHKFGIVAKPVPPEMTLSQWEAFVEGLHGQYCGGLRNFRATSLGGEPAREFVNDCYPWKVITLTALHKGRGYLVDYLSAPSYSATSDRRIYEAGRRAFQFTQK
jgi:hypothetical protein